ncbi:DUF4265 domain-containing protein [Streptomyces sp. NRRL S-1824]|uniref:DUF4265 domain-containing protein n=1 Tax=Streptomyces sp. NRRL S-1824 TaxID=1463889 RepID=UPI0004C728BC|nr:DUF4265 domain-containing protein [Streptomyces sp. NRRL S-1824]
MTKFIVHDEPVGRAQSNCIAQADLAPFGLDGQVEQLWLKPLDDGTFSVACIPFQTYGLALGDRVHLSANGQVKEIVGTSSHRVLRMLLMPVPDPKQLTETIDRIRTEIDAAGLLSEWSGDRHVAVDIPPEAKPSMLFDIMQHEVSVGRAFWEWADDMPFSTQG